MTPKWTRSRRLVSRSGLIALANRTPPAHNAGSSRKCELRGASAAVPLAERRVRGRYRRIRRLGQPGALVAEPESPGVGRLQPIPAQDRDALVPVADPPPPAGRLNGSDRDSPGRLDEDSLVRRGSSDRGRGRLVRDPFDRAAAPPGELQ